MEILKINGQKRLNGELTIHGSKNSALPILAASVLVNGEVQLHNCPHLSDVDAAIQILKHLGCKVKREGHSVLVDARDVSVSEISDSLMREMRSSIVFLGAILGRLGKARLSAPGGCEIGLRPIDLHLAAMQQLGAELSSEDGKLSFSVPKGLVGAQITLAFPSVGATENILLAAATAQGRTVLSNAAREPEISDLADFLNSCGAKIHGAGDSTIVIDGVKELHGTTHIVIPDRIEAATYLFAGAMTKGTVSVREIIPAHIGALFPILEEAGCNLTVGSRFVTLSAPQRLRRVKMTRTMPFPGFPTDAQAPLTAMLTVADGTSVLVENIFESRYKHAAELLRLGAKISVEGRMEVIEGVEQLTGASVVAPDLRGGMALVLAGLCAEGETVVRGISHIDRGYESPEIMLQALGADVKRMQEDAKQETTTEKKNDNCAAEHTKNCCAADTEQNTKQSTESTAEQTGSTDVE